MNHLPLLGDSPEVAVHNQRHVQGVTGDGSMWIYCLVQYADALLNQPKYAQSTQPFSPEQRQTWDRYGPCRDGGFKGWCKKCKPIVNLLL